ncbi:MAG: hypothetical protein N0C84_22540 [Candidatus Thiodiazotropha taylori]|uniref:Uncharacterized protein n=1 Tax=Candidatus Thiodiazotropha taylori TaxID=2792791 RepID=A0A9E4N7Y7_9GAMM|nr:hypothetical protein [Candidatus Thiodiazotropha taylori]MCW4259247.1 hypothetical protein [Candidatus Thiodiazotropha taylori]
MTDPKLNPDGPVRILDLVLVIAYHTKFLSMMRDLGHDDHALKEYLDQDEVLSDLMNRFLNVTFSELQRVGVQTPNDLIVRLASEHTPDEQLVRDLREKYFGHGQPEKAGREIH